MKIVRAMKKQSRLVGEIKDLQERIQGCISVMEENDYPEDYPTLLHALNEKVHDLIVLKTRIMHTNVKHGMFGVIVNLGELKNRLEQIKRFNPEAGVRLSGYSLNAEKTKYKSQISLQDKQTMIDSYQQKINDMTDKLDDFNAVTDLEDLEMNVEIF